MSCVRVVLWVLPNAATGEVAGTSSAPSVKEAAAPACRQFPRAGRGALGLLDVTPCGPGAR